jgi:Tol biopolymer transport system component
MGEVYKARDTRLQRIVAIKVSSEKFSERFEREARMISALNHPRICTVHDVGSCYLVMEFVDGETLQDRIARGPVPLAEALPIARQIVEALEAAHQAGIIHRDLKPANVKLTREGDVKVLDFGLAKLSESALAASNPPAASDTLTLNATRAGMIIGTPAYMAPEQTRGATVDKRADIWAFGCVLYELLTGRRPFQGGSTTETIAAVLRAEPDWTALPFGTPEPIRRLLRRCLEEDCKRRLTDIGVARLEIEDALVAPETPPPVAQPRRLARVWIVGAVALALIAGAAVGAWWGRSHMPQSSSWSGTLVGSGLYAASARISPDGKLIAFMSFVDGLPQLGVMTVDGSSSRILTSDRANGSITSAAWSRDGSRIYFDRSLGVPRGVYWIAPLGGEPHLVLEDAFSPDTLPDGTLTVVKYTDQGDVQMFQFWPDSGKLDPLPVFMAAGNVAPQYSVAPDGKRIAFVGTTEQTGRSKAPVLWTLDLASRQARAIGSSLNLPSVIIWRGLDWAVDGSSVYVLASEGSLQKIVSVPADGGPVRNVMEFPNTASVEDIEVAKNGSLYLAQDMGYTSGMRFAETGAGVSNVFPIPTVLGSPQSSGEILFGSEDGAQSRLLIAGPGRLPRPAIETAEATSLPAVLFDGRIAFAIGSHDGRRLAIASVSNGRVLQRFAGPAPAPPLDGSLAASPDGSTLFYNSGGVIWAQTVAGGEPRRVTTGTSVTVDPDGKHLYVKRNRNDAIELFQLGLTGGEERLISMPPDYRHTTVPLMPAAVDASGRLVCTVTHPDTFYYQVAVVDTVKGGLRPISLPFDGDVWAPTWLASGGIMAMCQSHRQTIWRYALKGR